VGGGEAEPTWRPMMSLFKIASLINVVGEQIEGCRVPDYPDYRLDFRPRRVNGCSVLINKQRIGSDLAVANFTLVNGNLHDMRRKS